MSKLTQSCISHLCFPSEDSHTSQANVVFSKGEDWPRQGKQTAQGYQGIRSGSDLLGLSGLAFSLRERRGRLEFTGVGGEKVQVTKIAASMSLPPRAQELGSLVLLSLD